MTLAVALGGPLPARVSPDTASGLSDIVMLFIVVAVAALVPVLLTMLKLPVPEVVVLLIVGAVLGESVLGVLIETPAMNLMRDIGIGFLFLLAGYQIDPLMAKAREGALAVWGWLVSLVLGLLAAYLLVRFGFVRTLGGVAIALTTTALGTLLPILRERGHLESPLGRNVMAAGAAGQVGPILAIALFLGTRSSAAALASLAIFAALVLIILTVPKKARAPRLRSAIEAGRDTTAQAALRWTILLLLGLLALASVVGLDVVLGAFVAGILLRTLTSDDQPVLRYQLEGIGYGLFIPLFFVVSGSRLNVPAMVESPGTLLLFLFLLLAIRGAPQFVLYRRILPAVRTRLAFVHYVSTAMALLVAVTAIEVEAGLMSVATASALVGAGVLSVLLFPMVALWLEASSDRSGAGEGVQRDTGRDAGVEGLHGAAHGDR